MYYYVEYLRAARALRVLGIILGLLLLAGIIFRLVFINHATPDSYISDLKASPTAHVSRVTLKDGTVKETIDDPQRQTHAVLVRKPNGTFQMDVFEPAKSMKEHSHDFFSIGHFSVNEDTHNGISHAVIAFRHRFQFEWTGLFVGSMILGFVIATMLGGVLAKENDGHLELAWTKPVSREKYALAAIAVDGITIVLAQVISIAVFLLCAVMWAIPTFTLGDGGWVLIALTIMTPLAWYACLTAFSASLKRGPGLVVGLGWLFAIVIPVVYGVTQNSFSPIAQVLHAIFTPLTYIDPIVYVPNLNGVHVHSRGIIGTIETALLGAVLLYIGYIALAVLQWRRVEA
jgi:hypothetical protein